MTAAAGNIAAAGSIAGTGTALGLLRSTRDAGTEATVMSATTDGIAAVARVATIDAQV